MKRPVDPRRTRFKPWKVSPDKFQEGVEDLGVKARIACAVMWRSKSQLMQSHREQPETTRSLLDTLKDGVEQARALVEVLEVSATRVLVAAAADEALRKPARKVRK